MIKTLVVGPNGKMGKAIIQLAQNHPMISIVGGIGPKGRNYIGRDLGVIAGVGEDIEAIAYDDMNEILHRKFRPEFLNRLDETIIFHGLSREDLAQIVDIQLILLTKRLSERKFSISLTDAAKDFLIEVGYDPAFGARPLKRAIQRYIQDQLALHILEGKFGEGDSIVVDGAPNTHELLFSRK